MMYPLVRELAAQDAPVRVPVAVSCRVLNFSRQAYYLWAANPVSSRDWEEAHLINSAIDHHRDDPAFGYRLIADEINASAHVVSERRIGRLCSTNGILSVIHTVGADPGSRPARRSTMTSWTGTSLRQRRTRNG